MKVYRVLYSIKSITRHWQCPAFWGFVKMIYGGYRFGFGFGFLEWGTSTSGLYLPRRESN